MRTKLGCSAIACSWTLGHWSCRIQSAPPAPAFHSGYVTGHHRWFVCQGFRWVDPPLCEEGVKTYLPSYPRCTCGQ